MDISMLINLGAHLVGEDLAGVPLGDGDEGHQPSRPSSISRSMQLVLPQSCKCHAFVIIWHSKKGSGLLQKELLAGTSPRQMGFHGISHKHFTTFAAQLASK